MDGYISQIECCMTANQGGKSGFRLSGIRRGSKGYGGSRGYEGDPADTMGIQRIQRGYRGCLWDTYDKIRYNQQNTHHIRYINGEKAEFLRLTQFYIKYFKKLKTLYFQSKEMCQIMDLAS